MLLTRLRVAVVDKSTTSTSRANIKRIISYSQIVQVRGSNVSFLSKFFVSVECTSERKEWMEQSITRTIILHSYELVIPSFPTKA